MSKKLCIDSTNSSSYIKICDYLISELKPILNSGKNIVFLCIGTDRSTGDSLGPLVGYKLRFLSTNNIHILGTLQNPIHSKNLNNKLDEINNKFKNPYIVAIDACLGNIHNIGKVFVEKKSILPGAALNKNLPAVGQMSITGIVNVSSSFDFLVLQNTRLNTVMMLSDIISRGIYHFILKSTNINLYHNNSNIISLANE
ncbi:spore protease YyaC [Clostridium weizhouense]|uniref:Spore protease YyaC n=1 Tax=Clostridium weizhouense TaxID=2859781 RepID=A0ABS7AVA8_9CLOT|nr:spore protease YyaC [Clostridium weizhouense]MBW6411780.1 spore protease YyaC [Clostridium weizhouense]